MEIATCFETDVSSRHHGHARGGRRDARRRRVRGGDGHLVRACADGIGAGEGGGEVAFLVVHDAGVRLARIGDTRAAAETPAEALSAAIALEVAGTLEVHLAA